MLAVDTSVVVAAFGEWHAGNADARGILRDRPRIAAHSILESYSVLTRLPRPFTAPADVAIGFLEQRFADEARLTLDTEAQRRAPWTLANRGISGGAVYDGLIALTVAAAGATLLSLDERAIPTYLRTGADARLIG